MFYKRAFKRDEKMSLFEELAFSHHYDKDTDLIYRDTLSVLSIVVIVGAILGVLLIFK